MRSSQLHQQTMRKFTFLFVIAISTSSCSDSFDQLVEKSRKQGLNSVAEIKEGLPYYSKDRLDPTWDRSKPGRLAQVVDFSLVDQRSRVQTFDLFHGRPSLVGFFFADCTGFCPMLMRRLKNLETKVGQKINAQIVAITVDPEHDSPARLKAFAEKTLGSKEKENWYFLTGDKSEIHRMTTASFPVETFSKTELMRVAHSGKIFLVDAQGFIRSVLNLDRESLDDRRIQELTQLIAETPLAVR